MGVRRLSDFDVEFSWRQFEGSRVTGRVSISTPCVKANFSRVASFSQPENSKMEAHFGPECADSLTHNAAPNG